MKLKVPRVPLILLRIFLDDTNWVYPFLLREQKVHFQLLRVTDFGSRRFYSADHHTWSPGVLLLVVQHCFGNYFEAVTCDLND